MTSEPRPSDHPRRDEDDPFVVDDSTGDELDRTFADVEHELGSGPPAASKPAANKPAATPVPRPTGKGPASEMHADADEFAKMSIDEADDVFVIDDEDGTASPPVVEDGTHAQRPAPAPTLRATPFATEPESDEPDEFAADEELALEASASAPQAATPPTLTGPISDVPADPAQLFRAGREAPSHDALRHDTSVEDALFASPLTGDPSERFGQENDPFSDASELPDGWVGSSLSPHEIGINANDGDDQTPADPNDADSWATAAEDEQDIEIVEDSDPVTVGDFAIIDGDPAQQFGIQPLDEEEVSAPASGVWDGADSGVRKAPAFATASLKEALVEGDAEETDAVPMETAAGLEANDGAYADDDATAEDEVDPIYGSAPQESDGANDAAQAEGTDAPDYSQYEEAYVDQTRRAPTLVGAPARPHRRSALAWAAAAALVLCGITAGFAFMQPEWLGLQSNPALIDRARIERPTVALAVNVPSLPADDIDAQPTPTPTPTPTPPDLVTQGNPNGTPTTEPVTPTEPVTKLPTPPDPKSDDPLVVQKDPTPTTPTPPDTRQGEIPPVDPRPGDPVAQGEPLPQPQSGEAKTEPTPTTEPTTEPVATASDVIRVGEDLQVGRAVPKPSRPRVHHLAEGLVTGSQAFAQLKNMNFFLGRVKAMDSSYLTLDLTPGEITVAFDDLNAIVPLASEEYRLMHGAADGFVKLTNRNKLFGKILTNSLADNVVLEVQQSHVIIPRASIEEVGNQTKSSVQVMDEDGDWIKAMLLRQGVRKAPNAAPPPPPPPTGNPTPARDAR